MPKSLTDKMCVVSKPLLMVLLDDAGNTITHLYPENFDVRHYALLIADVLRYVALHFGADEDDVLEAVQREIEKPTTPVGRMS